MPYILENGQLKNRITGHILAKHTTPEKAYKQIQAIHANENKKKSILNNNNNIDKFNNTNMKPEHKIRLTVEKMRKRIPSNARDAQILKLAKKMLKHEEMHGGSFWGDAWRGIKKGMSLPFDILSDVPLVKPAVELGTMILAPELAPLVGLIDPAISLSKATLGDNWNFNQYMQDEEPEHYQQPPPKPRTRKPIQPETTISQVMDKETTDVLNRSKSGNILPKTPAQEILSPYTEPETALYNPLEHIISSSNLSFPITYDPRDEPLGLREFLNRQALGGIQISDMSYNDLVKKLQPKNYLSFPGSYYKHYPSYQTGIDYMGTSY